jgi:hypothetical protein
MTTIILAIALLVALTGLSIEIGITSWSIRRVSKFKRRKAVAEHTLDKYAENITWLLDFLYNRYGKFADLEMEVQEGVKGVTGDMPIGETDDKYKDLKRASNLIHVTVGASDRMKNLMNSMSGRTGEDFQDDDKDEKPESEKPAENAKEESSIPEFAE